MLSRLRRNTASSGQPEHLSSIAAAKEELGRALNNRDALIWIDNAWARDDVEPFLRFGKDDQAARLITTRDLDVAPPDATVIAVDEMTPPDATALLCRGLDSDNRAPVEDRLDRLANGPLGRWPLLLHLANGHLTEFSPVAGLKHILENLDRALAERGIGHVFDPKTAPLDSETARQRMVWATISLSLERLLEPSRRRAMELAVFAPGADVTLDAVSRLWGLEAWETEWLVSTLKRLALAGVTSNCWIAGRGVRPAGLVASGRRQPKRRSPAGPSGWGRPQNG